MRFDTEYYSFSDGSTVNREYGKTPNGNKLNGEWVYRSASGDFIDFDKYRSDLFNRHNIPIEERQ